eukprot:2115116-Amphidinium_carterae.2
MGALVWPGRGLQHLPHGLRAHRPAQVMGTFLLPPPLPHHIVELACRIGHRGACNRGRVERAFGYTVWGLVLEVIGIESDSALELFEVLQVDLQCEFRDTLESRLFS